MNECVLVVDDDREIVRAIAVLLEKEGYQVLKAYDGLQALELAVEKPAYPWQIFNTSLNSPMESVISSMTFKLGIFP